MKEVRWSGYSKELYEHMKEKRTGELTVDDIIRITGIEPYRRYARQAAVVTIGRAMNKINKRSKCVCCAVEKVSGSGRGANGLWKFVVENHPRYEVEEIGELA